MRRRAFKGICGLGSLVAVASGFAARAQDVSASPTTNTLFDRQRTIAVSQRVQPGFEEQGTRAGDFMIFPRVRGLITYNDNVRVDPVDGTGDFALTVEPSVRAVSNWTRHEVGLSASGAITRFADLKTENSETYALLAQGRYDLGDEVKLFGDAGYRRDVERRSAPGALRNSVRPAFYNTASATTQLTWQGNRLRLAATGNVLRIMYADIATVNGPVLNSRDLDRSRYQAGLRADYALSANIALLATGAWSKLDYNRPTNAITPDRSANRFELLGGASFEFTDLLRGEIALGYIQQNFRSAAIRNFSGFGGRAELEYFPTRLTTVRLDASRTLQEAGNPLAPSYRRTRVGLRVDHELYRQVVISAVADYEINRFQLPDRSERRPHAGFSGQYLVDRHLTIFGRYDYLRVTTRPALFSRSFTDNVISVGALFKL